MYDLDHKTYVVLHFAAVDDFHDRSKNIHVHLNREEIIEVAAVKIKEGEIQGHFHSFIAIDGYDAHDLDFEDNRVSAYYAEAEHLIGAPSFIEVAERLKRYIGDSILVIRHSSFLSGSLFSVFQEKAQSRGFLLNNPTVNISNLLTAARLKNSLEESGDRFEDVSLVKLAQMLEYRKEKWADIFADYDIFFNPDSKDFLDRGRNDPLSWALAFARFFIALNDSETPEQGASDSNSEDFPF